jgi:hypothetical protein
LGLFYTLWVAFTQKSVEFIGNLEYLVFQKG